LFCPGEDIRELPVLEPTPDYGKSVKERFQEYLRSKGLKK